MISWLGILGVDSLIASAFFFPFHKSIKTSLQLALMFALFDAVALYAGYFFVTPASITFVSSLVILVIGWSWYFKKGALSWAPPTAAVCSFDNLLYGTQQGLRLTDNGTFLHCLANGGLFTHAAVSFAETFGLSLLGSALLAIPYAWKTISNLNNWRMES